VAHHLVAIQDGLFLACFIRRDEPDSAVWPNVFPSMACNALQGPHSYAANRFKD